MDPYKNPPIYDMELAQSARIAPFCTDQLPLLAQVGRGIKGDSARIRTVTSDDGAIRVVTESYDAATRQWNLESTTKNIAAGTLKLEYNMHPEDNPPTFSMVFTHQRVDYPEQAWVMETPRIPYIPEVEEEEE